MQLKKITITNYRNLSGQQVIFADDCNFIVGENNLGKSNILNLLQVLFSNRGFRATDFGDPAQPIEIGLQIRLADIEIGHFEDLFDTDDYHLINIRCIQETDSDNVAFYHLETGTFIQASVIRCINYIYYDSLRNPVSEINFDKGKGAGKFLSSLLTGYIETKGLDGKDFIQEQPMTDLLADVNAKLGKLKAFNDFSFKASSESDLESLLSRIIVLKNDKGEPLTNSGYGVQFLLLITLSILEKIHAIKQLRKEKGIFESETDHKKYISLIIGLDEPEIHLHPYMQRSLIKYLNKIISNQNADFQQLVKQLFGIDGFNGQIIVATHSPNILLNDYRQVIRLYPQSGTQIRSGGEITLIEKESKRLHMHFPYIKEAFFSRCVIFVEGDSEESSFPHFAEKMSIDLDELGISVIQSRGGEVAAIKLLIELAQKFEIPATGIGDRDNQPAVAPPLYLTVKKDFEEELISLIDTGRESFLEEIVHEFEDVGATVQASQLNKYAVKAYAITATNFQHDLRLADIAKTDIVLLKSFYLTWFAGKKSFPLGKLIGEKILLADIPPIYQTVINQAVILASR
jgi:putative ATP-dependent endonuclease of OLD family